MIANYEINSKGIKITTLKFQNEQLRNDLKREKEFAKSFNKLNEAREDLMKYLKRRKETSIEENDTQYKEMDTTKLFSNGDSNEFDVVVKNIIKKNRAKEEEIRNLKLEKESQAILLCEVTKQKKKDIEDKAMIEEDKRILANILEEKLMKLIKISNM